jgi:hypothetical protein
LDNLSFYVHSNNRCGMCMKMSSMVFELVVLPLWLPSWFVPSFFYMFSQYGLSSHNLCNVSLFCITFFFYLCYLFGTLWYWQCTPCFYNIHTFFTQHCHLLMLF